MVFLFIAVSKFCWVCVVASYVSGATQAAFILGSKMTMINVFNFSPCSSIQFIFLLNMKIRFRFNKIDVSKTC